jgi:LmbE family N-acetylglucosaminyl deacetylase
VTRGDAGISAMAPAETARVREAEERASATVVGVDTVEFLDGHTDGLIEYGIPLRRDLALAIRRHRPEVIVSLNHRESWGPSFNMADHRNVGLAVLDAARDAARDAGNRWVFTDGGVEPWSGVRLVAFGGSPQPTHFVEVGDFVERGIANAVPRPSMYAACSRKLFAGAARVVTQEGIRVDSVDAGTR